MTSAVPDRGQASDFAPHLPSPKIIPALADEEVLYTNSLGSVISNWVIVPASSRHSQTILALSRISEIKIVRFTHPGLLVIAGAMFLVAAAALFSKDGEGAELPAALLGMLFVIAYFGSRRAAVLFALGSESFESMHGSFADAAEFGTAAQSARARFLRLIDDEADSASFAAGAG